MKSLINCCDVYVSLHRSEGFGIGMAEAMKLGKVVISTNYSGNVDFTNKDTACVVDYRLIPVGDGYVLPDGKSMWADPDIEHAAFYMKKLYTDSEFYNIISHNGKKFIDTHYNYSVIGNKMKQRLKEIKML
jgi:glycosyltransferase involved in cell wall biosynthesis